MTNKMEKPSAEARALSLFLMAFKTTNPTCKEKSYRIKRLWGQVKKGELSQDDYLKEVNTILISFGGYAEVLEKTVQYYIEKTGAWKQEGDDKYCKDARQIADKILKKEKA